MIDLRIKGVSLTLDGFKVSSAEDPGLAALVGRWLAINEPMTGGLPERERASLIEAEFGGRVVTYTDPMQEDVEEGVTE